MPTALNFIASMMVIFFVFSVLVSTFTEIWNTVRARRAHCLWNGVVRMLGAEDTGQAIVASLKAHPAISSLASDDRDLASYIPSPLFAAALVDVLMAMSPRQAQPGPYGIGDAIAALEDSRAGMVLGFLWRRAGADPVMFQQQLATYFDQVMDRVSGWYKRGSAQRCFLVGLVCAAALNVDAVHVGRALWNDPHLAQQYASTGERLLVSYPPAVPATTPSGAATVVREGLALDLPIGWPAKWYQAYRQLPKHDYGLLVAEVGWTIFGFVIMACSCLIGAPLWFQLLSVVLPLRMAGKIPARSKQVANLPDAPPIGAAPPAVASASGDHALNYLEQKLVRNKDVRTLQRALGVPETGQFDTTTRSAIDRRQGEFGFERTGQVTRMFLKQLGIGDLAAKP